MDVRAVYENIGVDFADVLALLRKEERIKAYLVQTMDDPAFAALDSAMEQGDHEAAFRAAHTIKGMSMNLMLKPMTETAVELVECLRDGLAPGEEERAHALYRQLKASCEHLTALVGELA